MEADRKIIPIVTFLRDFKGNFIANKACRKSNNIGSPGYLKTFTELSVIRE